MFLINRREIFCRIPLYNLKFNTLIFNKFILILSLFQLIKNYIIYLNKKPKTHKNLIKTKINYNKLY